MNDVFDRVKQLPPDSLNILNLIQKKGPITLSKLRAITGMKMTRLKRLMGLVEETGLIVKTGIGNSTGGRRPSLYDINSVDFFVLSIAMSSTRYYVTIINLKVQIIDTIELSISPKDEPQQFVANVKDVFLQMLEKKQIRRDSVIGVGIGAFGSINRERGEIRKQSLTYLHEHWVGTPLVQMLKDSLQMQVFIDINLNGEALYHYLYGIGKGSEKIMLLQCALSIRASFISNGMIIRPTNDMDDAFGHMTVNMAGEQCKCGNYGCIECYSAIPAIIDKFVASVKLGRITKIDKPIGEITIEDIGNASIKGDDLAENVVSHAATALGCGLSNYIRLFNPDIVILTGLVIKYCPTFYEQVIAATKHRLSYLGDGNKVCFYQRDDTQKSFEIGSGVIFIEEMLRGSDSLT